MEKKKKQNIVPLKDLNLTDRFLFDEVLEDRETYQDVLSIIFGREIPLLDQPQTEKELRVSPLIRSVRLDVFAMSEEQSIYNTEMQDTRKTDLAKRSRYYQSLIDTSLLEPGIPNYRVCKIKLNEEVGVKYMQAWEEKYYEREEGREEGRIETLVTLVCKKLAKGMEVADIADMLEEEEDVIQNICDAAECYAPDYDVESITMELLGIAE